MKVSTVDVESEEPVLLTDYQIADRADREENKKLRVILYAILGVILIALLFAAYYAHNYEIY